MRVRFAAPTRILSAAVVAALLVGVAGCRSNRHAPSLQDWLTDQEFVLDAETIDVVHPGVDAASVLRVELDPLATRDDVEELAVRTISEIEHGETADLPEGTAVHFGILGRDFAVTDDEPTVAAIGLWRDVLDAPDLLTALAESDRITATSEPATMVTAFDELAALGAGARVDADGLSILLPPECEVPPGARELATALLADAVTEGSTGAGAGLDAASLDLCDGFGLHYADSITLEGTLSALLGPVDAAALGEFPIDVVVGDAEFTHRVALTPGPREAFGVVAVLDANPDAVAYDLGAADAGDTVRSITITAPDTDLEDLYLALAASPAVAFIGTWTIVAADQEFEGEWADLVEEFTP